jgi:hypothetical protein
MALRKGCCHSSWRALAPAPGAATSLARRRCGTGASQACHVPQAVFMVSNCCSCCPVSIEIARDRVTQNLLALMWRCTSAGLGGKSEVWEVDARQKGRQVPRFTCCSYSLHACHVNCAAATAGVLRASTPPLAHDVETSLRTENRKHCAEKHSILRSCSSSFDARHRQRAMQGRVPTRPCCRQK